MDKWQKFADYVMSEKMDKWAFGFIVFAYLYVGAQVVRWIVC